MNNFAARILTINWDENGWVGIQIICKMAVLEHLRLSCMLTDLNFNNQSY